MSLDHVKHVEAVAIMGALVEVGVIPDWLSQTAKDWLTENHPPPEAYMATMAAMTGRDNQTTWTPTRDWRAAAALAVKSHLDGDPKPRPDEIREWELMRRTHGIEKMLAIIMLPDESQTDPPFPGYQAHTWAIFERDGKVVCEPEQIDI